MDSFKILHNPTVRQIAWVRVSGPWKMVEIPTCHMSLQSIVTEAIPAYI